MRQKPANDSKPRRALEGVRLQFGTLSVLTTDLKAPVPAPYTFPQCEQTLMELTAASKDFSREFKILRWALKQGKRPLKRASSILKRVYDKKRPFFIAESVGGIRFVGDFGDAYARGCALEWQNEHLTAEIIANNFVAGGAYVDLGTNMALLACQVAKRLTAETPIYCFEPHPEVARRAAGTLALNRVRNARLYPAAVSDSIGTVPFFIEKGRSEGSTLGAGALKHANQKVDVPCVTLDQLADSVEGFQIGFLKVDVEGYEPNVFRGGSRILSEQQPPILFEINFPIAKVLGWTQDGIATQLRDLGYNAFTAYDGEGKDRGWPAPESEEVVNVLALAV